MSWEKSKTTDKEYNGKLDFLKDYMLGNYAAALKFGGKISQREKPIIPMSGNIKTSARQVQISIQTVTMNWDSLVQASMKMPFRTK